MLTRHDTRSHTRPVCLQKRELIARSGYLLVNRNHRKWERRLVDLVEGFAVLYADEHAKQRGDALEVHIPSIPSIPWENSLARVWCRIPDQVIELEGFRVHIEQAEVRKSTTRANSCLSRRSS